MWAGNVQISAMATTPSIAATEQHTGRWQLAFESLFFCVFTCVAAWPVA